MELERNPTVKSVNWQDGRGFARAYLKDEWVADKSKEHFPSDVPVEQLPTFFAGLFDADGSYDETQHRIRLASVHKSFLEGARRGLETLGIQASVCKGGKSSYGQKDGWMLVINGSSISRFAEIVPTQRIAPKEHVPYRSTTIKVTSVTPADIEDVYCCDVGVEEHSFCAEGVIISNCTEVTSADDSDVCNLGSLNFSRIKDVNQLHYVTELATLFLLCGTLGADLPYQKVYEVREKNRRLGLGIMGLHEWLIQRGYRYEVTPELHHWLSIYKGVSDKASAEWADKLGISRPVANRAIAPTGTIGILAGTTTGIEPIFAVAYKRRYLKNGTRWHYQYVVDSAAQELIEMYDVNPAEVESALDLAEDYERRIAFQADVQDYVDMAISSTINLPAWGTKHNNEDTVNDFANVLAKYAPRLRGFTCYPDGARGGQPLTSVPYQEAVDKLGEEFEEHVETHDICDITGTGGTCGV